MKPCKSHPHNSAVPYNITQKVCEGMNEIRWYTWRVATGNDELVVVRKDFSGYAHATDKQAQRDDMTYQIVWECWYEPFIHTSCTYTCTRSCVQHVVGMGGGTDTSGPVLNKTNDSNSSDYGLSTRSSGSGHGS